jgi:glycosyltransferase involved in cell wall biosynthesis
MLTVNIIVKNEEANIKRCLSSVKDIADNWVMVDTGSFSEETAEIAMRVMCNIPGKVVFLDDFIDYSHARNIALENSPKNSWILSIDADEEFKGSLPLLDNTSSCYKVKIADGYQSFWNYRLFNKRFSPHWVGPVHEIVEFEKSGNVSESQKFYLHHHRSGTAMTPEEKYNFYTSKLLKNFEDTGSERSLFYLFKTFIETPYPDINLKNTLKYGNLCLNSAKLGDEEKYICCFYIGDMYFNKSLHEEASSWFIKSLNYNTLRKESVTRLMQINCDLQNYEYSYRLATTVKPGYGSEFFIKLKSINDAFWVYFEISCYYSGHINKAKEINIFLQEKYPDNQLYKNNGKFY